MTPSYLHKLADDLEDGVTEDIWYDADDYNDHNKAATIAYVQQCMLAAANILRAQAYELDNPTK